MFCAETIKINTPILESIMTPVKRLTHDLFLSDLLKLMFLIGDCSTPNDLDSAWWAYRALIAGDFGVVQGRSYPNPNKVPGRIRLIPGEIWKTLIGHYTSKYSRSTLARPSKKLYRPDFRSAKCLKLVSTGSIVSDPAVLSDIPKLVKLYGDAIEFSNGVYLPRRVCEEKSSEWKNLD